LKLRKLVNFKKINTEVKRDTEKACSEKKSDQR